MRLPSLLRVRVRVGLVLGLRFQRGALMRLASISQTTTHMHGHHEATMGLAGVSLGRELRALALSHTASVRRGTA
eukprot:scaffold73263_cov65-Phaeocystis_antarctica.AAC.5